MTALTITAAQALAATDGSGNFITGLAGATLTVAQPVYLDAVTNTYKLAVSTVAASAAGPVGLTTHAALAGQPIRIQGGRGGDFTLGAGAAPAAGMIYCVGAVAGTIVPSADLTTADYVTVLGVGKTGNKLQLDIFVSGSVKP